MPLLTLHIFISKLKPPNLVTLPKISLFRLFEYIASIDVEDLRMASGDFGVAAHNLQFALQNCYYAYCYVWGKVFQRLVKAWKEVVTETRKEHIPNFFIEIKAKCFQLKSLVSSDYFPAVEGEGR